MRGRPHQPLPNGSAACYRWQYRRPGRDQHAARSTQHVPGHASGNRLHRTLEAVVGSEVIVLLTRNMILTHPKEHTMARTPGAKNRTPRELRAEAKRLNEKADLLDKLAKLKKKDAKK